MNIRDLITLAIFVLGLAASWGSTHSQLLANNNEIVEVKAQVKELSKYVQFIRDEQVKNSTLIQEHMEESRRQK